MKYKKCEKCEGLNYILNDIDDLCSVCLNKTEDKILAIILNIDKDFQKYMDNNKAFGKLDFEEINNKLIYERTRSKWRISNEREKQIVLVLSVIKGIVYGVWKPIKWKDVYDERTENLRKEFVGVRANEDILNKYLGRNISSLIGKAEQNPVKYFSENQILECPSLLNK